MKNPVVLRGHNYRDLPVAKATGLEVVDGKVVFNYEFVHHVDSVTQEFIDWLQRPFHINVFVTPYVSNPPHDKISSNNESIVANITGKKPSLEGKAQEIRSLKKQLAALQKERDALAKENKELRAKLKKK